MLAASTLLNRSCLLGDVGCVVFVHAFRIFAIIRATAMRRRFFISSRSLLGFPLCVVQRLCCCTSGTDHQQQSISSNECRPLSVVDVIARANKKIAARSSSSNRGLRHSADSKQYNSTQRQQKEFQESDQTQLLSIPVHKTFKRAGIKPLSSSTAPDCHVPSDKNRPSRQIVRVAGVYKVCHLLRHRNLLKEFRQYRKQRRLFVFVGSDAASSISKSSDENDAEDVASDSQKSGTDDMWLRKVIWPGRDFQRFIFDNPFASSAVKAAVRLAAVWNIPVTLAPSEKALELMCRSRKHEGLVLQVDARKINMRTTMNGNSEEVEKKRKWVALLKSRSLGSDDGQKGNIPSRFLLPAWSLHTVGIKEQSVVANAAKVAAFFGTSRIFLSAGCPWDCFYGNVENIPVFGVSGRPADFISKSREAHPGAVFIGFGAPVRRLLTDSPTDISELQSDGKTEMERFRRLVMSPRKTDGGEALNADGWPHRVILVIGSGPGGALPAPVLRQCSAVLRVDPNDPLGNGFRVRVSSASSLPAPVPSSEVYSEEDGDVAAMTQLLSEHGVGCGAAEAVALVAPLLNQLIKGSAM